MMICMCEPPGAVSVCMRNSSNMSFLDIKDPAKRTALVDEYVIAMKTAGQRNMVNRGQNAMGNRIVHIEGNTLKIEIADIVQVTAISTLYQR